tara:strand:+ start:8808 stop:9545 length:738 start_codon:yes stop_codon:yes gene_type:complete
MRQEKLKKNIEELGNLFSDMITDETMFSLDEEKKERANELIKSISEYLISFPGTLIYESDAKKVQRNKAVIDLLWETVETDHIFDEIISGGYFGLLVQVMSDYAYRAKQLKPTFIGINPDNTEFATFFDEAMNCWLFGLKNASMILCFTILEETLEEALCQVKLDYVYELKNPSNPKSIVVTKFRKLISDAHKEELITSEQATFLKTFTKKRNNAVHRLYSVTDSEALDYIIKTKETIEHLLSKA